MDDDLLELDLHLDAVYIAELIVHGRLEDVETHIEESRYRDRLERYKRSQRPRRQRASRRESLPQPPGDTS